MDGQIDAPVEGRAPHTNRGGIGREWENPRTHQIQHPPGDEDEECRGQRGADPHRRRRHPVESQAPAQIIGDAAHQPQQDVDRPVQAVTTVRVVDEFPEIGLDFRRRALRTSTGRPDVYSRVQRRTAAAANAVARASGWRITTSTTRGHGRGDLPASRGDSRFTLRRQRVEPSPRSALARGDLRILPAATKQAHHFQSTERSIEGPVGCQEATIGQVGQLLRDFVAVELASPVLEQVGGAAADGEFEGHQCSGFATHAGL